MRLRRPATAVARKAFIVFQPLRRYLTQRRRLFPSKRLQLRDKFGQCVGDPVIDLFEQLKVTPEGSHGDFLGWHSTKSSAKFGSVGFTVHYAEKTKYTAPIRMAELTQSIVSLFYAGELSINMANHS